MSNDPIINPLSTAGAAAGNYLAADASPNTPAGGVLAGRARSSETAMNTNSHGCTQTPIIADCCDNAVKT